MLSVSPKFHTFIHGRTFIWAAVVFLSALLMRSVFLYQFSSLPMFDTHIMDMDYFHRLATEGIPGTGFPDGPFFKAPLYPLFLKLVYTIFGAGPWPVRVIQALIGSGSALLTFLLAGRLFSRRVAVIAGLLVAFCGTLILFDGQILVPSLTIFLNLLSLYCLTIALQTRRREFYLAGGLLLGLSAIARPTVLAFAMLMLAYLVWVAWKSTSASPWRTPFLFLLGVILAVAPVTIHNVVKSGELTLIGTYSGVNLYIGNNLHSDGVSAVIPGTGLEWWDGASMDDSRAMAERDMGRSLSAAEQSSYWRDRAVRDIVNNPGWFAGHLWRKLLLFMGGYELANNFDIYYLTKRIPVLKPLVLRGPVFWPWGVILPLAIAGMILAGRRSAESRLLVYFLAASIPAFLLFFVTARYRMPLIPILSIFAGYTIDAVIRGLKGLSLRRVTVALACFLVITIICHLDPYGYATGTEAQGHQMIAAMHDRNGNQAEAERYYRLALAEDSTLPHANNDLGLLLLSRGDFDQAIQHLERAVRYRSDDWLLRYNLAYAYLQTNRPADAVPLLKGVIQQAPHFARAAGNLGRAYLHLGQPQEAGAAFRLVIEADSLEFNAYHGLGIAFDRMGEPDSTLFYLRRALQVEPAFALGHYSLGLYWFNSQEPDSSEAELRQFLRLWDGDPGTADEVRQLIEALRAEH